MYPKQWDDFRLFLAVARTGKLISAGKQLGIDHTTVARRLTAFEAYIGTRLIDRSPRGATLTQAGQEMVGHAERIETEVEAAAARLGHHKAFVSGNVRLATPEAFGTFLVAPNVSLLHARHPQLRLELVPESRLVNLVNREADIAVTMTQPPRGRLVGRRLTDYRIGIYASVEFLAQNGPINTISDISKYPFIWWIDELIDVPELRVLDDVHAATRPVFFSTSLAAQRNALAGGLGLGMLHTFEADLDPRLVRVLADEVEVQRSYWMVFNEDQKNSPRVRAVADFLNEIIERNRARF